MRENRPYGSEGGEQRYCSPTPIDCNRAHAREHRKFGSRLSNENSYRTLPAP